MNDNEDDNSSYCGSTSSNSSSSYSSEQKAKRKKKQRSSSSSSSLVVSSSSIDKAITTTTTTTKKKKATTTAGTTSSATKSKRIITTPKKQKATAKATATATTTTTKSLSINNDEYYNRFITNDIQNRIETTIQRILRNEMGLKSNNNNISNIWNEFMLQLDLQYVNRSDIEQCFKVTTTTTLRDDNNNDNNDDNNDDTDTANQQIIEQNLINLAIRLHIQDEKCKIIFQMIDSTDNKQFITVHDLRTIVDDIFGSSSNNKKTKRSQQNGNLENVSNDELQEMIDYFIDDNDDGILNYTHIIKIARTINL